MVMYYKEIHQIYATYLDAGIYIVNFFRIIPLHVIDNYVLPTIYHLLLNSSITCVSVKFR